MNDKNYVDFRSFLAKITKFAKNIWERVIENVIILGQVMADFVKYVSFLLNIEQKSCLHT